MVQFPRSCLTYLWIQYVIHIITDVWVTPFGHPRITGCLLLTEDFRSLPRPSSPDSAKASTMDPYSLDHIILYPFASTVKDQKDCRKIVTFTLNRKHQPYTNARLQSYGIKPMGLTRVELVTSRLSGVRSNRLSYRPRINTSFY